MNVNSNASSSDKYFFWFPLIIFFSLGLTGILHHEIWLDEAHHWLIAKDSHSILELYNNMRYDGHPILWNILLFFISRVSDNIFWMQLLNLVLCSVSVLIFLRYAPFSKLHKILFVFGYFILYEYTVISRNYGLILLLGFICLALYPQRKDSYVTIGIVIAFLANTHLFGLILGGGLTLVLLLDFVFHQQKTNPPLQNGVFGFLIILFGISISILQIIPPEDTKLVHNFGLPSIHDYGRIISFFTKGFLPIPDLSNYHFWNTSAIINFSRGAGGLLSLILILIPLVILQKKPLAITFFYSCAFLLMVFFSLSGMGASRYFGIIYITFILAYWLSQHEKPNEHKLFKLLSRWPQKLSYHLITILLAIHVVIIIPFYYFDLTSPFSEAKATVNYLRDERLDNELIVVENCMCTSLSAYLNKPLYYLSIGAFGSYCPWNNITPSAEPAEVLKKIKLLIDREHRDFIFIYAGELAIPENESSIKLLKSFNRGMVISENYFIYRVSAP